MYCIPPTKASVGRHEKIQRVEIKTDIIFLLLHHKSYNRIYYILLCGFSMCVPIILPSDTRKILPNEKLLIFSNKYTIYYTG